jgi:hypothetical protein
MWTNISACVNVDCGSCFENIGRLWLSNKNFVVVNVFTSTSLETKELYMLSGWSLEKCESSVTQNSNYDTKLEASLSSIEDVRTRAKAKQAEAFRKSTRQIASMNEDMKKELLRACLGLLCSQFHSSTPTLINQTHPTLETLLPEKVRVQPQLHVFPGVPQEVLPKFKF